MTDIKSKFEFRVLEPEPKPEYFCTDDDLVGRYIFIGDEWIYTYVIPSPNEAGQFGILEQVEGKRQCFSDPYMEPGYNATCREDVVTAAVNRLQRRANSGDQVELAALGRLQ